MFRVENIESYIERLTKELKARFGDRLLYLGLQGSYLRGEATKDSDIDIMVILDDMTVTDMEDYRKILVKVGDYEKSCGFICGREEMRSWNPLEVCQLLHTTRDCHGKLEDFVPAYTEEDERNYVKLSLGNLFHELCHRYIHADRERNISAFPHTCKSVFFILQNMHYLSGGEFLLTKKELLEGLRDEEDKKVLALGMALKGGGDYDFDSAFSTLFEWCQHALLRLAGQN